MGMKYMGLAAVGFIDLLSEHCLDITYVSKVNLNASASVNRFKALYDKVHRLDRRLLHTKLFENHRMSPKLCQ